MAARRLFRQPLTPFPFRTTFFASTLVAVPFLIQPWRGPLLMETSSRSQSALHKNEVQTPVMKNGRMNALAIKQMSAGSTLGLVAGLAVSMFSTSLAVVIGLLVFGAQFLESKVGVHVIPHQRLQAYFKSFDIRSAVQDHAAFKMSFGLTFALAAFAKF